MAFTLEFGKLFFCKKNANQTVLFFFLHNTIQSSVLFSQEGFSLVEEGKTTQLKAQLVKVSLFIIVYDECWGNIIKTKSSHNSEILS